MRFLLWLIERLWGSRLARQTQQQLVDLVTAPAQAARRCTSKLLQEQANLPGPHLVIGHTEEGQPVKLPHKALLQAHWIISGSTGSGKTMAVLLMINSFLAAIAGANPNHPNYAFGFGILDPKTELFLKTLYLLARMLAALPPAQAEALLERIVIIDVAASTPLTSYNIARLPPGCDPDFFATMRVGTIAEMLSTADGFSVRGSLVVRELFKLLAETAVPFGYVERVLTSEEFRNTLVARASETVRDYFRTQFPKESKATLAAVQARLSSTLLSTESLRLALCGEGVPDFRRFQDEGKLVLINCGGANLSRMTGRMIYALFLSDFRQAVFTRQTQQPFVMFIDEAQVALRTKQQRENMDELLRLSRSFGTHLHMITQNVTAGVGDADLLEVIQTNTNGVLALRSTPRDVAYVKSALPITGRLPKPRVNPFTPVEHYSLTEERTIRLEGVAHLPDRVGWLWLKALSSEAMKIKTAPLEIPTGITFTRAVEQLRSNANVGQRTARPPYLEALAKRELEWRTVCRPERQSEQPDKVAQLKRRYRKTREQKP